MSKFRKVVIVGGGPSGSICGLMLKRLGVEQVEIIERYRRGRDKTCAGGISPRAMATLRQIELLDEVRSRAQSVNGAYLMTPQGHRPRIVAGTMAYVMRRTVLDELLLEKAESQGARITTGRDVDRLLKERGRIVGVGAGAQEIEADLVVLATGARGSLCWDPRPRRRLDAVLARYQSTGHEQRMVHLYYHRKLSPSYFWLFPESDDVVNVGLCRRSGPGQEPIKDLFERVCADCFPQLANTPKLGRLKGHPIVYSENVDHLIRPGGVRIGEAAWLTDGFTGEGIWHAMESAALAARAISKGCIEEYERVARATFDPALRLASRLTTVASTNLWSLLLRASEHKLLGMVTGRLVGGIG